VNVRGIFKEIKKTPVEVSTLQETECSA
ncbi:MAG: hypothetical protein UV20_C0033G0007, partial [Candidatus Magasanikbacteria bacterium GW2011_GWA2_42_32]